MTSTEAASGVCAAQPAPPEATHRAAGGTLAELQAIIQEKYDIAPEALDPNQSMREHGLDSLALAEFLFEVEDRLGLILPDDPHQVDTLAGLADLVDRVRAENAAKA